MGGVPCVLEAPGGVPIIVLFATNAVPCVLEPILLPGAPLTVAVL